MKKRIAYLITILNVCLCSVLLAQRPKFEWAVQMGGKDTDYGRSITFDCEGNVYTTGLFHSDTVDFNPGLLTNNLIGKGFIDSYVQKLDSNGNLLWIKRISSTTNAWGRSICTDLDKNVYIIGNFTDTIDLDPGTGTYNLVSKGLQDIFIQKLDSNGNFKWAKRFGDVSPDVGWSIKTDVEGNVYCSGVFRGQIDFDPGPKRYWLTSAGKGDNFILKLDSNGNFAWAKRIGGQDDDYSWSLNIDQRSNVYLTGGFIGTVDFDPGKGTKNLTSSLGNSDIFILKLDSSGDYVWAKGIGGKESDKGLSINVDNKGNIIAMGQFRDTVDFDPGPNTYNLTGNLYPTYILKLDSNGNFIWALNGNFYSTGYSFSTIDKYDHIYITGSFERTIDFDPGKGIYNMNAGNKQDIFILKLDNNGMFLWAKQMGNNSGSSYGNSIMVDDKLNLYTTGRFSGTTDFDPGAGIQNLQSHGKDDIFVQKLIQCTPFTVIDTITACYSYQWIDSNTYFTSNYKASYTKLSTKSCDSIFFLNLTIDSVSDISTTVNMTTITANNSNASYQWLDCNNNYSKLSGKTYKDFSASISGSYAVEVNENGCIDTSACITITVVGLKENSLLDKVVLYPNPISNSFSIEFEEVQHLISTTLLSASGQEIETNTYTNTKHIQSKINYPTGMYFLEIINQEKNKIVIKILKE